MARRTRKPKNYDNKKKFDSSTSKEVKDVESSTSPENAVNTSREETNKSSTGINDPEWYTKFPELAYGAGNIPFSDQLGSSLKLSDLVITGSASNGYDYTYNGDPTPMAIPGVCSIVTKPSYGFSVDINDPLNVAASAFYTNVRYVNSGRKNYDQADLMIATMAIADLYSYINWCQRLYGYCYMYSVSNRYINEALISANGVNVGDITEKLANFRYWLNTFISRVSAFAVPADINMFRRRAYMYAHLYTESTTGNLKDQLYQFVPDGWYVFALDSTGKGCLDYRPMSEFANTKWTLNNIIAFGEIMLSNITGDEDFGLISGDIIKSYGSNIIKLAPVPEALIIPAEYEEYTLSQMRNAHLAPVKRGTQKLAIKVDGNATETFYTGDVMQANNGNLISVEGFDNGTGTFDYNHLYAKIPGYITVTNPNPSVSDVLEASRLVTCGWPTSESKLDPNNNCTVIACGSDIAVGWIESMYGINSSNVWGLIETSVNSQIIDTNASFGSTKNESEHFHWAPQVFKAQFTPSGTDMSIDWIYPMTNIDNYALLSWRNVANLHEVALISLLAVPGVASLMS